MLTAVDPGAAIVVCNSCRRPGARGGEAGGSNGAALVAALRRVKASARRYDGVAVQEMACLFACADACTVQLRAPGRINYVLGRFEPCEAAARAILDYAVAYAASPWGEVAFADWPDGVKGHFIARTPPDGFVVG